MNLSVVTLADVTVARLLKMVLIGGFCGGCLKFQQLTGLRCQRDRQWSDRKSHRAFDRSIAGGVEGRIVGASCATTTLEPTVPSEIPSLGPVGKGDLSGGRPQPVESFFIQFREARVVLGETLQPRQRRRFVGFHRWIIRC